MLRSVLFDFDGTLVDTEGQYTEFWAEIGREYLPHIPDFAQRIKGNTLRKMYDTYFRDFDEVQMSRIEQLRVEMEHRMTFPLIPGAEDFVKELRSCGVSTAIVTSSDRKKMENPRRKIPHFISLFDQVLTAEDFRQSKPSPEPYLTAARRLGSDTCQCVIFEDALNGLRSALASGMLTVALTTENPREVVEPLSHYVISDFRDVSYDTLTRWLRDF